MPAELAVNSPAIDDTLVRRLVTRPVPQWRGLPLQPVKFGGWDNKNFRLGEQMVVRLPRAAGYAAQVEKEHHWLPCLAPWLPLQIPEPLAMGEPDDDYPWQ